MIEVEDEVFLPLPLNDRQLDILRRVDVQPQTLVQGPPGTGKTHLAAALISHLLAQGKRVLVTAHTDQALKEVRNKLPEEIKPLAVAVVGADRADLADLKVAVNHISRRAGEEDPEIRNRRAETAVTNALTVIDQHRRRCADLRTRLLTARADDVAAKSFAGYSGTLAEIARMYQNRRREHGWLLEYVTPQTDSRAPLTGEQAARWLVTLRHAGVAVDETEARQLSVDITAFPAPTEFAEMVDRTNAASASLAGFSTWLEHPAFDAVSRLGTGERAGLRSRITHVTSQIRGYEQRREPWMSQALLDLRVGRGAGWFRCADLVKTHLDRTWQALQYVPPGSRIEISDKADRAALASLAHRLLGHVRTHGPLKVNPDGTAKVGAFSPRAVKDSRLLLETVRVDGRQPLTPEALDAVRAFLDAQSQLSAVDLLWPSSVVVPSLHTVHERFYWHAAEHDLLRQLLIVGRLVIEERQRFDALGIPQPNWSDLGEISAYSRLVDAADARDDLDRAETPLHNLQAMTASAVAWAEAAPVCLSLDMAVQTRDRDLYRQAYERARHLVSVGHLVSERDALTAKVKVRAPALARAVTTDPGGQRWDDQLPQIEQAWDWARVGEWISIRGSEDANSLQQQLDATESGLRATVGTLAATRAWQHALEPQRLTGQAQADLKAYALAVRQLGKGTGKYAAQRRAEIRQAMDRCRSAVPIWIMPIYRIAEQLQVAENMFDVVIVDEASQAGIEATFLQYLAPKVVVIGDDKQVSPAAVGVEQQRLRDLADHYLADNRYKHLWQDPKVSLFDAASIWFGAKRTLVEHRRCVPEIIEFSNRVAYLPDGIRLIPVRQFGSDRLEPIRTVHVPTGYESGDTHKTNRPEAEAIVEQVEKCLADPSYDGRTLGVISLLGPTQARLINNLLLECIPPEEWQARELRCGDAAAFQGSERDVIFLSMVSAPKAGRRMGSLAAEANVQRYNVAASRAKDQLWLFHTVTLDQLSNPVDMRFQLLDYCYNGVRTARVDDTGALAGLVPEDVPVAPFDSLFEQRVHNRMVERGYTVIPQFEALGYRMDLVVVGAHARLAVECDGDHWHGPQQYLRDLVRERDLRRCGWQFFRVRESAFYIDQQGALSGLWTLLEQLGIRPGRGPAERGVSAAGPETARLEAVTTAPLAGEQTAAESLTHGDGDRPTAARRGHADSRDGLVKAQSLDAHALRSPEPRRRAAEPASYRSYPGSAPAATRASRQQIALVVRDIVAVEGPVLGSRIQAAYVQAAGGQAAGDQRVDTQIVLALKRALNDVVRMGDVVMEDPRGPSPLTSRTFRLPDQPRVIRRDLGPRLLDQIPPLEMAAHVRDAAAVVGWDDTQALFRVTLRRLGHGRLTSDVEVFLTSILPLVQRHPVKAPTPAPICPSCERLISPIGHCACD